MITLAQITREKLKKFTRNRVPFFSAVLLTIIAGCSLVAPWIANDRPYLLSYRGQIFFPIVRPPSAIELDQPDAYLVNYHNLKETAPQAWAIFPPIRFNPYESNNTVQRFPSPPSLSNPLGTDDRGRDVFARLLYGFRFSFLYALGFWLMSYTFGTIVGLCMGFYGGAVDFLGQRVVEIIVSMPSFFLLIILISIFEPSLSLLIGVSSLFGWITISFYMRAEAIRLRRLEFIEAARAIGQSNWKILVKHVLPNALTPLFTLSPFAIAASIAALAQLDYLGFGLPPPTPSWGELLNQARTHLTSAWWLAFFPSLALFGTLSLLISVGEGLKKAFDPKNSDFPSLGTAGP